MDMDIKMECEMDNKPQCVRKKYFLKNVETKYFMIKRMLHEIYENGI